PDVPMLAPHIVGCSFSSALLLTTSKHLLTITMNGPLFSMQGGYDIYLVPHIPIPPAAPDPLEAAQLAMVLALAGSKAQMSVHSVTGGGGALAPCITGAGGSNINCNDPIDGPTGVVYNLNTVMTAPTAGDYAGA